MNAREQHTEYRNICFILIIKSRNKMKRGKGKRVKGEGSQALSFSPLPLLPFPFFISSSGNVRPGLHYVNLAAHVGPFYVLVAPAEDALDKGGGSHQIAYHIVCQHLALARDWNFAHAASLVESQQAVFFRASQDLYCVRARAI